MTDTALGLALRVLPKGVPIRQWECSLPWRLRVLCGYDSALSADVMKATTTFGNELHEAPARRHRSCSA